MFSQASVCQSPGGGGGVGGTPNATWYQVRMSTPSLSGTRSECLPPPPGPGQNVYPPRTRSECLPPPPGPGQNVYPPPPGPGQNVYPLPPNWNLVRTSTPPRKLDAGGRYASYCNAFLLQQCLFSFNHLDFWDVAFHFFPLPYPHLHCYFYQMTFFGLGCHLLVVDISLWTDP